MMQQLGRTWVWRKKEAEKNFAAQAEALWRDVKVALEDSGKELHEFYEQDISIESVNGNRIRVHILKNSAPSQVGQIDISRDSAKAKIEVSFLGGNKPPLLFRVSADHEGAFIVEQQATRLTADEISQRILEPIFFGPFGRI